jgi:hypothetical protein
VKKRNEDSREGSEGNNRRIKKSMKRRVKRAMSSVHAGIYLLRGICFIHTIVFEPLKPRLPYVPPALI